MNLISFLKTRNTLCKLILLISSVFVQSCSDDERLEGYRQSVLTEQKFYETVEKNHKLVLSKPQNIISWTHGGSEPGHSLGNVAFSSEGKFSSHSKVKVGPKGEYSEPIFQNNRIFHHDELQNL